MPDAAITVPAGTDEPAGLGRIINALQTANECSEAGDDVEVITY